MRSSCAALAAIALTSSFALAQTATVTVPASANPWLAGMPAGSTASGDGAPAQSPVLVPFAIVPGGQITFSDAQGTAGYAGGVSCPPEGCSYTFCHGPGAENGISNACWGTASCLIGVFLGDERPDLTPAPAGSDFQNEATRGFHTLSPILKQVFFIGDGLAADGATQVFIPPPGATRLFLGTSDGSGWYDNPGAFTVTITQPSGPTCGDQDYNGDGDFGTDQDIEAFFSCLGGNCCPTCFSGASDFNGDGDYGTDADIEAFFRVLGGGNC